MLYNRASARPDGTPWSERKKLVWWDADEKKWTGFDVPDFEATKPPDYEPPDGATAQDALSGTNAFIMQSDGRGWLFAPAGLADGPLPAVSSIGVRPTFVNRLEQKGVKLPSNMFAERVLLRD